MPDGAYNDHTAGGGLLPGPGMRLLQPRSGRVPRCGELLRGGWPGGSRTPIGGTELARRRGTVASGDAGGPLGRDKVCSTRSGEGAALKIRRVRDGDGLE
jgi:hypothetical protein